MNLLRRAGAWLRARMIPDVRRAWRFASIRIAAAGALFEVLLQSDLLAGVLPAEYVEPARYILWGAVAIGRIWQQPIVEARDAR